MTDSKTRAIQWAEEARSIVMTLQMKTPKEPNHLKAMALLANAIIELARKE